MMSYDYDYFVIGAGSGGVRSARIAASHGAKVGIAENLYFGGTCVNVGCVPKKLLSYASHFSDDFEDAKNFGWDISEPKFSWSRLIENKNTEIKRLNGIYENILKNNKVDIHHGMAKFVDNHTLDIDGKKVTADKILIAVGAWPNLPLEPGAKEYGITSNEVFYLKELPKKILIAGGGYIALEFASILKGMGSDVTLIYRGEMFLRGFDDDLRKRLHTAMQERGIHVGFNAIIDKIEKTKEGLNATLSNGTQDTFDQVMYAIGRTPKTKDLGLENTTIKTDEHGAIIVDDNFKTTVDNIYAVGDVIDRIQLTPVAIQEGHFLADYLFKKEKRNMSYANIPTAIFTTPNIGTLGLTEEQARAEYKTLDIYEAEFRPMKNTISGRNEKTYMKLIVDASSQKVLGVHMIGPDSPEIIQMATIPLQMNATKKDFDNAMALHPSVAEEFVTMRNVSRH